MKSRVYVQCFTCLLLLHGSRDVLCGYRVRTSEITVQTETRSVGRGEDLYFVSNNSSGLAFLQETA